MRQWIALIGLAATGCALTVDNIGERYGEAFCDQQRKCNRGAYDRDFTSHGDCVERSADFIDQVINLGEIVGCEFDPKAGHQLLHSMRTASCEEWVNGDFGSDDSLLDCSG